MSIVSQMQFLHFAFLIKLFVGDGKLFVCGWNKEGQLGLPFCDSVPVLRPLDVGMGTRIIEVSCGWNHTLALSEAGSVLAWGSNAFGQLGVSRPDLKRTCEPLELDRDVS